MQKISNWSTSVNTHGHLILIGVGDAGNDITPLRVASVRACEDDSKTAIATDMHGKEHVLIV